MFGWKANLWVFQSIIKLYLSSEERPGITRFEDELMTLNTMMLWCLFRIISNRIVSWVTTPRGLPSITSIGIGFFL